MNIHPTAVIDPAAIIAPDCRIGAHAVIDAHVTLGLGCVVHPLARILSHTTLGARNIIHSTAVLGDWPQDRKFKGEPTTLHIGDDNIFREGVTIHRATGANGITTIGSRNYFMAQSHVGHNCTLGNDITLVNSALLGGHVHVADNAIVGAHTAVHQFCRIGRLSMISNAANVNVDIPPFFTSMTTNSITQLNAVGLRRNGVPREHISALREVFQLVFRGNRPLAPALADLPPRLLEIPEIQELITFCQTTKRGVARFAPWSDRNKASGDAGGE